MKNLNELARMNNLSVINFGTSYGLKEGEAIIGFASFQDAVEFAEKNKMKVATFKNEVKPLQYIPSLTKVHVQALTSSVTTKTSLSSLRETLRTSRRSTSTRPWKTLTSQRMSERSS